MTLSDNVENNISTIAYNLEAIVEELQRLNYNLEKLFPDILKKEKEKEK